MAASRKKFEYTISVKEKGFSSFKTARSGMSAFNKEIKAGSGPLKTLTSDLGLLTSTFLGFIGVIGAGVGISSLVTGVVSARKEMQDLSNLTGQSVSDFEAYAFGVQSVGLAADKLADISKDTKDKIGDFLETGGGAFADFMENVATKTGIAAEELIKMSGPDALIAMKDAMDEAGVSSERQIFYLEAIASDASLLLPLLQDQGQAWHDLAENAREMGVAISDLDNKQLIELAQTLDDFRLSIGIAKREIVLALAPAIKDLAKYFAENREEFQAFVVGLADSGVEFVQFIKNNYELIAVLTKVVAGIYAVTKVGQTLVTLFNGIRAASLAMTGGTLITWLTQVVGGLRAVNLAALSASASLGAVAGGAGAYLVGMSIGKKIDEWEYFRDVTKANAAALEEVPGKFKKISSATGVVIRSFEELDEAQKNGTIAYDDAAGEWVKAYGKTSAAATQSAKDQEAVTGSALEEMKKQYASYVDEVQKLQQQIVDREQSLYEQLRSMARSGMSNVGAWRDLKKEAEEYRIVAEAAASAGDWKTALKYADMAKEKYAQLNTEVKDGDKVLVSRDKALKTAMEGVEASGELGIKALKEQQSAAKEAMEALTEKSGWQNLAKSMDEAKQQWLDNWEKMQAKALSDIDAVGKALDKIIKDRDVYVNVHAVENKSSGGSVGAFGFAAGGSPMQFKRLASPYINKGGGLRDDVPAMLKRKEFVQPPETVDYYGVDFMERLRRRLVPKPMHFAAGGTPQGPVSLSSAGGGQGLNMTATFNFAGDVSPMSQGTARKNARLVITEIEKMYREGAR